MRIAGGNVPIMYMLQTCSEEQVHAIPHPSSLRSATFPPGEGFGAQVNDNLSHFLTIPLYHISFLPSSENDVDTIKYNIYNERKKAVAL